MTGERPPELWEAATEEDRLALLIDEMIGAALAGGGALALEPSDLTLNVSNVVVERSEDEQDCDPPWVAPGDYLAVTIAGETDLGPDATWCAGGQPSGALLGRIEERLVASGARFAYVRRMPPRGSVTVFLARLTSSR